MVRKISSAFALILTFSLSSCIFVGPSIKGNGHVVEENRAVKDFDEIKVSRGMNVFISQGDEEQLMVKADENIVDAITTKVEDGVLKVSTSERIRSATSKKVFVTVVDVEKIGAFAGCNVYSETVISSDKLDLECTAGSNMKLEIEAGELKASTSAGSNIKAGDLTTQKCKAKGSSGANVWIRVTDSFSGKASSGANVFYYGRPETINVSSSSGGNVRKKN